MFWIGFKRYNLMLTVNLLPWRDYARARQKKIFKMIALLSIITSCMICFLIYHHLKIEFNTIEKRIVRLTKKSEKYINKPDDTSIALRNIINKSSHNQDQLKKLLHAMFLYSTITWDTIEVQKGIIKISGTVNLKALLLSFIDYCGKQFNFTVAIKSIKILTPFNAIKFQIQVVELKNNGLD
jgi:hypothetical protein